MTQDSMFYRESMKSFCFLMFIYLFEREGGREKERKKNINMCEKYQSNAPHTLPARDLASNTGICPDRNQTSNLLVCRKTANPLSHTSQGHWWSLVSALSKD